MQETDIQESWGFLKRVSQWVSDRVTRNDLNVGASGTSSSELNVGTICGTMDLSFTESRRPLYAFLFFKSVQRKVGTSIINWEWFFCVPVSDFFHHFIFVFANVLQESAALYEFLLQQRKWKCGKNFIRKIP